MNRFAVIWVLVFLGTLYPKQLAASELVRLDLGRGPFNVLIPDNYDPATPAPILVMLHGYTASGFLTEALLQFAPHADAAGMIYTYPDGTRDAEGNPFWNATDGCCNFFDSDVDDVAYLSGVVEAISEQYNIDRKRIFFMGHSNGGFMSYRMACDRADLVAGIVSLAGSTWLNDEDCNPSEPVHVLQIHGTNDTSVPIEGREGRYPGALDTIAWWAAVAGCEAVTTEGENLDLEASRDGAESTVLRYETGCAAGGSSELWTMVGAGHVPVVTNEFRAKLVEFFQTHPKADDSFDPQGPTLLAPHIASSWNNLILADNLGDEDTRFGLTLYDESGNASEETVFDLAAGSFMKLDPRTLVPDAASAVIRAGAANVSFRVAYIHPTDGGTAEFVLGSEANGKLYFNFGVYDSSEVPLTWKGLAAFNPGDTEASAVFTALNGDGEILATATSAIAPRTRMRALLGDLFDLGESTFRDVARVTLESDQPLIGLNISGVGGAQLLFSPALGGD